MIGLAGQAVPTMVMAVTVALWRDMPAVAAAVLIVGGSLLAGVLKAPVAASVYPLAAAHRPHLSAGRSAARIAQGMTVGGLLGPLAGSVLVSTAGAAWLLPASVLALGLCALGTRLDRHLNAEPTTQPQPARPR